MWLGGLIDESKKLVTFYSAIFRNVPVVIFRPELMSEIMVGVVSEAGLPPLVKIKKVIKQKLSDLRDVVNVK